MARPEGGVRRRLGQGARRPPGSSGIPIL